jgi:hypothetical protein
VILKAGLVSHDGGRVHYAPDSGMKMGEALRSQTVTSKPIAAKIVSF